MRELDDTLSDADLDGMIAEIDGDGSGTVDFDGELMDMPFITPHSFPMSRQQEFLAHYLQCLGYVSGSI